MPWSVVPPPSTPATHGTSADAHYLTLNPPHTAGHARATSGAPHQPYALRLPTPTNRDKQNPPERAQLCRKQTTSALVVPQQIATPCWHLIRPPSLPINLNSLPEGAHIVQGIESLPLLLASVTTCGSLLPCTQQTRQILSGVNQACRSTPGCSPPCGEGRRTRPTKPRPAMHKPAPGDTAIMRQQWYAAMQSNTLKHKSRQQRVMTKKPRATLTEPSQAPRRASQTRKAQVRAQHSMDEPRKTGARQPSVPTPYPSHSPRNDTSSHAMPAPPQLPHLHTLRTAAPHANRTHTQVPPKRPPIVACACPRSAHPRSPQGHVLH